MDTQRSTNAPPSLSRSGLILGAAGLAGVGVLAAIPGLAGAQDDPDCCAAADASADNQLVTHLQHAEADLVCKNTHRHYTRTNFDRAHAVVVLHDAAGQSMTVRVDDVSALRHADGAARGSKDWAGGFSVLMTRTKGAKLGHGTFTATTNGTKFPLTISLVYDDVYQAIIDRFMPKGA